MHQTKSGRAATAGGYVLTVLTVLLFAACGGGGGDSDSPAPNPPSTPPPSGSNSPPTILGSPVGFVEVGQSYSFQPTASDPENNSLTFTITNKPSWADFNASTGRLSGSPASRDVGTFPEIEIKVSDGNTSVAMPRFSITVTSGSTAPTPPPSVGACSTPMQGTHTYDVGPGKTYTELTSVPWLSLQAGDVVNIYYRPEPYRTKIGIRAQGTDTAHVIINGVTDSGCNRPMISGENAVTTTDAAKEGYYNQYSEGLGTIVLFKGPRDPWGYKAKFLEIRNLMITGAKGTNSYTSQAGSTARYEKGAAGIYGVTVEDLLIENCEITGNDNGLFVNTKNDNLEETSYRVTVRRNQIHLNGVKGSYLEHNLYVQAVRPVYEGNYIGQLIPGALGSSLKDRSSGTIVRYNYIVAAARALDLVETEGGSITVYVDPLYNDAWVYGNVIVSDHTLPGVSSNSLIHWGGDNSPQYFRSGTLYFYHNTVVTRADSGDDSEMHIFDLPSDTQKVELRSNVLAHSGTARFELAEAEGTVRFVGTNWITSGWTAGNFWSGNSVVVELLGNLIEGKDPGLQADYTLASGSSAIDAGAAAPANLASRWIEYQYAPPGTYTQRATVGAANDLGAFERR